MPKYQPGDLVSVYVSNGPMIPKRSFSDRSKREMLELLRGYYREYELPPSSLDTQTLFHGMIVDWIVEGTIVWYKVLVDEKLHWCHKAHIGKRHG